MRKPPTSADRERFVALASEHDAYVRHRPDRVDVHLHGVYRMFAVWLDGGPQAGAHVRGTEGVRSERFRGAHNWIHLERLDFAQLPAQLAEARTIAASRGAGMPTKLDVYKPLAKAVEIATQKPEALHAGGPRAKVLSGERELAIAICKHCMARVAHLGREGEPIAKLSAIIDTAVRNEAWWPAAHALPYGTDGAKRLAEAAESVALQMVRATIGAQNSGSQSCVPYATRALVRIVRELEVAESLATACAFLVEIDELVMTHEFAAALAKHARQVQPIERVLWRGADAKGYPAWWLVRIDAERCGLLGKLGKRWMWIVDGRDAVLASVPDEQFEIAVETALVRDATRPAAS